MIKRTLTLLGLGLSLALAIPAHAAPPPNIVLMLIDDLGWQELKCYDIGHSLPPCVFARSELHAEPMRDHERQPSRPRPDHLCYGWQSAGGQA